MIASRADFTVHEARLKNIGPVTGTLAEAFLGGDLAHWLIEDRETRRAAYADYFWMLAEFFLRHGQVDVTADMDAVALWLPVENHVDINIPDYDERLAKITGDAVGRFVLLDMTTQSHHPQYRPHHYLSHIAVHPDRHGQGLASALLRHRLAQLDQDGVPAYLEATGIQTRAIYEHFGFRLIFPVDIPSGPTLFPMWRAAGGAAPHPQHSAR
ncbi:GNAT family N-acetyltransferase [Dactylosporangium sp. NPDC005572]|uniref:GNAT family N-acetyltransferase n=1 Tax=Dactylosporangium sp. NPDC005572 TaxID=3156889 RepID=UPI0033BB6F5C